MNCRERFLVGQISSFRGGLSVRGGSVVLGENLFAGGRIQIGGGGNGDPFSLLYVGDGTYLGDEVFINICRPVVIGREVFLTQRSILVTHNIGHSILEGFENRFAPIVLEDYSQVGMNSTLYAGIRLGQYAVVGSNSYVVSSIPARKLAMGVPAKVLRDVRRDLSHPQQVEVALRMVEEFRELLKRKGYEVWSPQQEEKCGFVMQSGNKRSGLLFKEKYTQACEFVEPVDALVIWTLDSGGAEAAMGTTLIDLLAKTICGAGGPFVESSREYLRKCGIRPMALRGRLHLAVSTQSDHFSLELYEETLNKAKRLGYAFPTVPECKNHPERYERFLLLRHDIDSSPRYALKMAQLEQRLGVRSSFYVLLHSIHYNPAAPPHWDALSELIAMGFEVGLHYETDFFEKRGIDPLLGILDDAEALSKILRTKILSVSQHRPASSTLLHELAKHYVDAYANEFMMQMYYISDSGFKWRGRSLMELLGAEERIHALIHPLTWSFGDLDMEGTYRRISGEMETEIRESLDGFIVSTKEYLRKREELDRARVAQQRQHAAPSEEISTAHVRSKGKQ